MFDLQSGKKLKPHSCTFMCVRVQLGRTLPLWWGALSQPQKKGQWKIEPQLHLPSLFATKDRALKRKWRAQLPTSSSRVKAGTGKTQHGTRALAGGGEWGGGAAAAAVDKRARGWNVKIRVGRAQQAKQVDFSFPTKPLLERKKSKVSYRLTISADENSQCPAGGGAQSRTFLQRENPFHLWKIFRHRSTQHTLTHNTHTQIRLLCQRLKMRAWKFRTDRSIFHWFSPTLKLTHESFLRFPRQRSVILLEFSPETWPRQRNHHRFSHFRGNFVHNRTNTDTNLHSTGKKCVSFFTWKKRKMKISKEAPPLASTAITRLFRWVFPARAEAAADTLPVLSIFMARAQGCCLTERNNESNSNPADVQERTTGESERCWSEKRTRKTLWDLRDWSFSDFVDSPFQVLIS